MATEIVLRKDIPKNPIVIEGFPSKGFVSTIATRYIIDELEMKVVGYIRSDHVKSIAVVHGSVPMHPVRIYAKDNIVLIFSEINIPIQFVGEFSDAFVEWFREIKPGKVFLLAGIACKEIEKEREIFSLTNDIELEKKLHNLNVEKLEEGMLTGISSDILLSCIEDNIPTVSLMAETRYIPDPLGAAALVDIVNKLLGLGIDVKKLEDKGEEIEVMFKDIMNQMRKGKECHEGMNEYSPMYA
ncbi:MAG TPA: proteasome assembly chaperone family protein [Candidatus Altiarchaeales archaeon]|nr:proteasome assembly chaperone family protein [Candidatus Altiarchaeales archaeon]